MEGAPIRVKPARVDPRRGAGGRRARRRSPGLPAAALVATALFALASFGFGAPPRLVVQPSSIDLRGAGDEHGLLVTYVGADGRAADVTDRCSFSAGDAKVAAVSPGGRCAAISDGKADVFAEYDGIKERVSITCSETAAARRPSFRQDVLPALTQAGCNSGGCHGKGAGQNGFRLSLRGYAPDWDYDYLAGEMRSRRLDYADPGRSLIVLKPLGQVPHEGGKRFAEGSRTHKLLTDWVAARAPGPDAAEADAQRLEVLPGGRSMRPGEAQQLLARAAYADGRVRDVTWLCQFFSNDETTVAVTPEGRARALRPGAAAVRVHFQGLVEVVTFTMPYENAVDPAVYAHKNNLIDEHVFATLADLHVPPSPACDDAAFVRRAFLDATGTLPAPAEALAFLADARGDKRARLVDELLGRPEFVDYWTLQWDDLLQNRKERDHDVRGAKGVRAFQAWLRRQVADNRPWNELARDVLTASGDSVAAPQIGYYITNVGEKTQVEDSDVADAVAQSFLGTRIGCARCHNHPLEKFTQDDYYHFAAFFSRVSMRRKEPEKGTTVLAVSSQDEESQIKQMAATAKALADAAVASATQAGAPAAQARRKMAEQHKALADAFAQIDRIRARPPGVSQPRTKKPMAAQTLDRQPLAWQSGQDPRRALADWITDPKNEAFSGSLVNRLWKHFMGVGLVEQVDDLRSSNPPTNPALWKALSAEFVARGYDVKHVMRLILNSRAYQLSSATLAGNEADRKFYSHYYARRLPAEVLLDAISQATGVPDSFPGYPVGVRAAQLPEPGVASYFLTLFGRSDRVTACACERSGEVTLPQLLHLQNGDGVTTKLRGDQGRLAGLLKAGDDRKAVDEIFLATVSRPPTPSEMDAVNRALADGDPKEEVYRDLFWALLNSKAFAFNH